MKRRDFRLLLWGQGVSSIGSAVQIVALSWMLLSRGSAADLGLSLLFLSFPQALMTLVGGFLIDFFHPRLIMISADSLRALTACLLASMAGGRFPLWEVWIVLFLHGIGSGIFASVPSSLIPCIVQQHDLEYANGVMGAVFQFGPLIGYLCAGFLVSLGGPVLAFWLNAGSYIIAVVAALMMHPIQRPGQQQRSYKGYGIKELADYLHTVPWLLGIFVMDLFLAFAAITINSIGLPLLAKTAHAGPQGYSMLAWGASSGAILGLLAPILLPIRSHRGWLCIAFQTMEALSIVVIAFVPFYFGTLCMAVWNALNGFLVTATLSLIQHRAPRNLYGRVIAFLLLASTSMLPVAQVAGGFLATAVGARPLFLLAGGIVLLGSIVGLGIPGLRRLD